MAYLIDLSLLKHNSKYRWLYLGQFVSFFGTMITFVALPYQVYHQTQSTLMVGLLSLVQLIPLLFTALLGGVFADRYHRRILLWTAEILLALGCLLLAFNALLVSPHIWAIFVVGAFASALSGIHRPSLDSITQQIVDKKDLPAMGSLMNFMYGICMIAGPASAGLLIAHFGIVTTFLIDFATFVFSLFALFMMGSIPKQAVAHTASILNSLKESFQYVTSRQELIGTYLVDFLAMIFGMPMALFPAIAQSLGGVKTLGMLYAAPAVGALVISLFSGWTSKIKYHGLAIAIAAALWGVAIIFFGLATNVWVALFFLALAGAFDAISGVFRVIMWNETIPNELFGRISGISMISYLSGPKLGDTEAGLVAAAFGVTFSIISGGILCVISVAACCLFLPKFTRYKAKT